MIVLAVAFDATILALIRLGKLIGSFDDFFLVFAKCLMLGIATRPFCGKVHEMGVRPAVQEH